MFHALRRHQYFPMYLSKITILATSIFILASCTKKDVSPNANPTNSGCFSASSTSNGQAIEGQYIVTYKSASGASSVSSDVLRQRIRDMILGKKLSPSAVKASFLGKGGEIFILDMGEPIKIVDLAKLFIKLSGFVPEKDIKIVFTGLRPGEKLTEELFTDKEHLIKTKHDRIFVTKNLGLETRNLHASIRKLINYALISDDEYTRRELLKIVATLKNHD